ncbi:hypothetical protein ACFYXS_38095 [Streptomyces sp. NPDC002574]|uniref:hypothetical protein n=1 Tax=Streptomyces sp. NPDC002574 TaxID=3364652 RepID=UPI0036BB6497
MVAGSRTIRGTADVAADFTGDFETHFTLPVPRPGDEERIRARAELHGLKYTRIVLDRGAAPDQPMPALRGRGTLPVRRDAAARWTGRPRAAGFDVARVKIEAAPWNADVPRTGREAPALPSGCSFEHHVKLAVADPARPAEVRAVAGQHASHVSRNARRDLGGRGHERFVIQRCRGVGRPQARLRLDPLLAALRAAAFPVVEVEEEFVVHDDRPALDDGWIDEEPGR